MGGSGPDSSKARGSGRKEAPPEHVVQEPDHRDSRMCEVFWLRSPRPHPLRLTGATPELKVGKPDGLEAAPADRGGDEHSYATIRLNEAPTMKEAATLKWAYRKWR